MSIVLKIYTIVGKTKVLFLFYYKLRNSRFDKCQIVISKNHYYDLYEIPCDNFINKSINNQTSQTCQTSQTSQRSSYKVRSILKIKCFQLKTLFSPKSLFSLGSIKKLHHPFWGGFRPPPPSLHISQNHLLADPSLPP